MNPPKNIAEKIRKLLRLSKSSNKHEAESALAHAMRLADEHQIDVAAMAADDEEVRLVCEHFKCGGMRLSREWRNALTVVEVFFNVSTCVLKGAGQVAFIGTACDITIADYVSSFIVRRCRAETADFFKMEKAMGRRKTPNKTASFIEAYFTGIFSQLRKVRNEQAQAITGFEIVLQTAAEARKKHMHSIFRGIKKMDALAKPQSTGRTIVAGFNAGMRTKITPAIGQDAPLALPCS